MPIVEYTGHMKPWKTLGVPPGTCTECAVKHEPGQPHNQQSLVYQYSFYDKNGRWPTWKDAMAHCSDEVKKRWICGLKDHGVIIEP
jgi:hypothetical protein